MLDTDTPIQFVKGVGPAKSEALAKAGIRTVYDLLQYLPFRYEDRSRRLQIKDVREGQEATVEVEVVGLRVKSTRRRNFKIVEVVAKDETGQLKAVWFNQEYLKDTLKPGRRVLLFGKFEGSGFTLFPEVKNPQFELVEPGQDDTTHAGRIVPVYERIGPMTPKHLRRVLHFLVAGMPRVPEVLPAEIRLRRGFPLREEAIALAHFPSEPNENVPLEDYNRFRSPAQRRLIFEEFFLFFLGLELRRARDRKLRKKRPFAVDDELREIVRRILPFRLTGAQRAALKAIADDLASEVPMRRLLQGDVGSGKTVVAALALARAADSGLQGALMAPTQILAEQHAATLAGWLEPAGLAVGFLSATVKGKARQYLLSRLASGALPIVVGTHALLQDEVRFHRLGLVIVDEQHRFGVEQRLALAAKGASPHVMVMTATPIPRSLALSLYADLEVSVIDELPKGRLPVRTRIVPEARRGELYGFLRRRMAAGDQVFVVVPLIEESAALDLETATAAHERYAKEIFPDLEVGLVHGRLSAEERARVMDAYRRGEVRLLVSTTVIEVGVDVPAANVMVIENAERFGLAQLHQLRGRIGRGDREAWCFLFVSRGSGAEGAERLQILRRHADGFRIAEEDLRLRGPGDFFGTQQHGVPRLVLADLARDAPVLARAKAAAFKLVAERADLGGEELSPLREALARTYEEAARYYGQG